MNASLTAGMILSELSGNGGVAAEQGNLLVVAFHPELTTDFGPDRIVKSEFFHYPPVA